jgi:hypothetical protein
MFKALPWDISTLDKEVYIKSVFAEYYESENDNPREEGKYTIN